MFKMIIYMSIIFLLNTYSKYKYYNILQHVECELYIYIS